MLAPPKVHLPTGRTGTCEVEGKGVNRGPILDYQQINPIALSGKEPNLAFETSVTNLRNEEATRDPLAKTFN